MRLEGGGAGAPGAGGRQPRCDPGSGPAEGAAGASVLPGAPPEDLLLVCGGRPHPSRRVGGPGPRQPPALRLPPEPALRPGPPPGRASLH